MSKRQIVIYTAIFILFGIFCGASIILPRMNSAGRFIQYDTADNYISDIQRLECAWDPNEFYDSYVYVDGGGDTWLTWLEYLPGVGVPGQDQICLRKNKDTVQNLLVPGVYSTPTIAKVDANGAWITYETQDQSTSQWEINLVIPDANGIYSNPVRISSGVGNCINHNVAADPNGNIWVVWQEDNGGQFDIMARRILSTSVPDTKIHKVSTNPRGDWRPDVTVATAGNVCIVWDSYFDDAAFDPLLAGYEYESFNVLARWFNPDANDWSNVVMFPHPTDPIDPNVQIPSAFQGYAQVVADPDDGDTVWILWEEGGGNWGGVYYSTKYPPMGWETDGTPGPLHNYRKLRIGKLINDYNGIQFYETVEPLPMGSFNKSQKRVTEDNNHKRHGVFYEKGKLIFDKDGRLWVFYRHFYNSYCQDPEILQAMFESGWKIYGRYLDGGSWSDLYAFDDPNNLSQHDAYWKLDPLLYAADSSDNDYKGTLYGDPSWLTGDGIDGCIEFDGTGDYVEIDGTYGTAFTGIAGSNARTCAAWIKTNSEDASMIMSWGEAAAGEKWMLALTDTGKFKVGVWSGYIESSTSGLNDGQWHHVAAVLPDESDTVDDIDLYIDGQLETDTYASNSQTINTSNNEYVIIGARFADGVTDPLYLDGRLDDVRIYDQALTASDISDVKNLIDISTQPEAHWKLDSLLYAPDSSDNDYTGTLYGDPSWLTGDGIDGCIEFDGDDYVEIDGVDGFAYTGISGNNPRTCSASIYLNSKNVTQMLMSWGASQEAKAWMIGINDDNKLFVGLYGGQVRVKDYNPNSPTQTVTFTTGTWYDITVALGGDKDNDGRIWTQDIYLYINGTLQDVEFVGNTDLDIDTSADMNMTLGVRNYGSSQYPDYQYYFNGMLDDVRISDGGFNDFNIRDGIQRLSVAACADTDDIKLGWTVGRTDNNPDPLVCPGKNQINPAALRGIIVSEVCAESNASSSDPNLIIYTDPNLIMLSDPNVIETTEPNNILYVGGRCYSLVMGDMHRHTDFSLCQAYRDGTLEDAYRYAIEVAGLDYMAITDHDIHLDSGDVGSQIWWRNCKELTRHRLQDTFLPFYGYETDYYNETGGGHLNVISLDANRLKLVEYPNDDSNFLDNVCRDGRAFTIPHALDKGTILYNYYTKRAKFDHYRNVWEIYQGCRDYAPYDNRPSTLSRQEEGVQSALKNGQHFGLIASSDHVSTSRSFACVWTPEMSTEGIFQAIRARQTYAATDKIHMDFRIDGHMMGERFAKESVPNNFYLDIKAENYDFRVSPGALYLVYGKTGGATNREQIDSSKVNTGAAYSLNDFVEGTINLSTGNEYYFYVQAIEDETTYYSNRAWSSPIWCVYESNNTEPIHHWTLNEKMEDEGIAMNHGICFGDPQWSDAVSGKALLLDGDDYVEIAGSTGISGLNPRTCTAWVKTDSTADAQMIMSWGASADTEAWMVALVEGKIFVGLFGGTVTGSTILNDGQLHHVAIVLGDDLNSDGRLWKEDIQLYVDGQLETVSYGGSTQIQNPEINTSSDMNVTIGVRNYGGSPYGWTYNFYFNGLIDDVQIYDRALSENEILKLSRVYNVTKDEGYFSIQDAIDDADDFDEIMVYPGTYNENINFSGKDITVRSVNPGDWDIVAATIIDGNEAANTAIVSGYQPVLSGFTIMGGTQGIYCSSSSLATVDRCIIRDNSDRGVKIEAPAAVTNCIISDNGNEGVFVSMAYAILKNNLIYNHNNGIKTNIYTSSTICNCTIVNNVIYGITIPAMYASATIKNCILWDNGGDLENCTATYSCVEENNDDDPLLDSSFHLSSSSPCIDAGDNSVVVTGDVDIDGDERILDGDGDQTATVDIGADEYVLE